VLEVSRELCYKKQEVLVVEGVIDRRRIVGVEL
jgi:hypothetical protein